MVGLIQFTKPARMVYLTGHGPHVGVKVLKGFKGSLRGAWPKRAQTSKVLKVSKVQGLHGFTGQRVSGYKGNHPLCSLFFVLLSDKSHHQADACHLASVYLGFCSIWNTHFCLRLQPHLYPVPVETSVGRSDGTRQRYKSTHV